MICVSIGRTRHTMMVAEYRQAAKRGAPLVELRLDYLRHEPDFKRILAERPCPVVISCRRPHEGGRFIDSENKRLTILRTAIAEGIEYVDLEIDIASQIGRFGKTKRIISYHDFHETPLELEQIHSDAQELDPDIIKLATMATDPADNVRALELMRKAKVPTIAFCMGEIGIPSRILAGRYGAPFTYAAFNIERPLAPGQLTFADLRDVYHYDEITRATEVYGLIGSPVAHSLSPLVHNAAFRQLEMDAVYLPFDVPRRSIDTFLLDMESLGVKGYSVTIPHKEVMANTLEPGDEAVRKAGAANTLVHMEDRWLAYNTDYRAAVESLEASLPERADTATPLAGKPVLVLGAGGAARAVVHALAERGAAVTIANRTEDRAQELARRASCRHVRWENRHETFADIVINCTPIGMHPNIDESPLHSRYLREGLVVFDIVYNPEQTLLIKQARDHGAHTITGVDMFVRQAALQFELFTGNKAPEDLMATLVRRELSPARHLGPVVAS